MPYTPDQRAAIVDFVSHAFFPPMIVEAIDAWGRDANGRPRRVTTREVKGIDGDVRLNRALWLLSHRMAELKHAA